MLATAYPVAMEELGLFPLGIVLLPTERVPLHIFEPRYRELIGECVDSDGEFGLLFADDDGIREIGTRARVFDVLERFPDGRLNIVVEGGDRFRTVRLTSGRRSFHTAEVEAIADDGPPATAAEAERALDAFRRVAEAAEADADAPPSDTPLLSFELAGRVELPAERKQELLELRSEPERLRIVAELFDQAERALRFAAELRGRAAKNGMRPDDG